MKARLLIIGLIFAPAMAHGENDACVTQAASRLPSMPGQSITKIEENEVSIQDAADGIAEQISRKQISLDDLQRRFVIFDGRTQEEYRSALARGEAEQVAAAAIAKRLSGAEHVSISTQVAGREFHFRMLCAWDGSGTILIARPALQ